MHTVTVNCKKTGETVYKKEHFEMVSAVKDYNKQYQTVNDLDFKVHLKPKTR